MTDDSYAAGVREIEALRERLAHLEDLATAPPTEAQTRSNPVTIIHATDFSTREERRSRDLAATYRFDPAMERLIGLARKSDAGDPVAAAALSALSPSERMAMGYHANARAAAVSLGLADAATGAPK